MEPLAVYLSPAGLAMAFAWNFAVLSSIQLTVRLIRAFSFRDTLLAALLLTAVTVPVTMAYNVLLRNELRWLPVTMALTAGVGLLVAVRVLRFRRQRSALAAAVGIGLLSAPWGAFLVSPPR
ncbi:MAG TPA: hypothetical protein VEQ11_06075 [Chloroflexota bacterium]|nr:hypothetical protein [Chloroflexota bacterium]